MANKIKNLIGQKFGHLTLIEYKNPVGTFICDCGTTCKRHTTVFRSKIPSCGCVKYKWGKRKFKNGQIVDGLEIIEFAGKNLKYKIKCRCGQICIVQMKKYKGKYPGCGCLARQQYLENLKIKYIGIRFGRLTVVKFIKNLNGHNFFELKCSCGNKINRKAGHLFKGESCGCLIKDTNKLKGQNKYGAKYSNQEILVMRELYGSGSYSYEDLGHMFNESKYYIKRIVKREIWKSV